MRLHGNPAARYLFLATGLTVPPANSKPVPSQLGLLPERMFVLVSYIKVFVLLRGTP